MDLWFFLMEMVMLLGGAFLLGSLAQRLRQSPIIGYLLAGTVVGPLLFNAPAVNQAAELGVSLLLFSIGLEFSFKQLGKLGRIAFGGGTVQIVSTIIVVTLILISYMSLPKALTIGAIAALSSTTIVLRLLVDRSEIDSMRGRACLGILLLQDIAIVPLVLMVSLFSPASTDTSLGMHMLKILASVAGLAALFYLLLYRVAPLLLSHKTLFANRELSVLLAISVGLGATWGAHAAHISPALGAFVAGMLLGESPFATQIRADIGTLRIIMVTLFFASVGMLANPLWFIANLHWVMLSATAVFVVKALIIYGVARLFGLNNRHAIATGITLGQIGEFSFVLAAAAREGGVLESNTTNLIISVIIVLMLATPYLVAVAVPLANKITALLSRGALITNGDDKNKDLESVNRVIVIGLGPSGRQVVNAVKEKKLVPVAIDMNPGSLAYAEKIGIKVYLGDADHEDVLRHAGLSDACMAVVTIPDPATSINVVRIIRRLRPEMTIAARCRYNRHTDDMVNAGADMVIDEETATGETLGRMIVESIEESSGAILACRLGGKTPEISV
jgi:CPA2 family monovalent cation:H+ antiporter-2